MRLLLALVFLAVVSNASEWDMDMSSDMSMYWYSESSMSFSDGDPFLLLEVDMCMEDDGMNLYVTCDDTEAVVYVGEDCGDSSPDDMMAYLTVATDGTCVDTQVGELMAMCYDDFAILYNCDYDISVITATDDTIQYQVAVTMAFSASCSEIAAEEAALVTGFASAMEVEESDVALGTCTDTRRGRRSLTAASAEQEFVVSVGSALDAAMVEDTASSDTFTEDVNTAAAAAGATVDSTGVTALTVVTVEVETTEAVTETTEAAATTAASTDTTDAPTTPTEQAEVTGDDDDDDSGSNTGAIVGGIVGALVLLALFGWCMYVKTHPKEGLFPCCGSKKSGGSGNVQMA